jgi:hypothetical protein
MEAIGWDRLMSTEDRIQHRLNQAGGSRAHFLSPAGGAEGRGEGERRRQLDSKSLRTSPLTLHPEPLPSGRGENFPSPGSRLEPQNRSATVSQTSRSLLASAATGFQHSRASVHGEGIRLSRIVPPASPSA